MQFQGVNQVAATDAAGAEIRARELKRRLDAGAPVLVVDVREPHEFQDWHIPGAVNAPLSEAPGNLAALEAPPGAHVVTVCLHGARSAQARDTLADQGVDARSLAGGMVAWNTVYDVADVPAEALPGGVRVRQLRRVGKGCVGYVVASGGDAVAIDPTLDADAFLDAAEAMDARVTTVLDTHAHADHVSGARRLAERADARYLAPAEVGEDVAHGVLAEGDVVPVGTAVLMAVATPGHTPGALTYRLAGAGHDAGVVFTGDTLFVESVGRPDLGQDPREGGATLWRTLRETLLALPDETLVLPGHFSDEVRLVPGEAMARTTGELKRHLPALSMGEDAFVEWATANATPQPDNFREIKAYNQGAGDDLDEEDLRDLEAGPNRCAVATEA